MHQHDYDVVTFDEFGTGLLGERIELSLVKMVESDVMRVKELSVDVCMEPGTTTPEPTTERECACV